MDLEFFDDPAAFLAVAGAHLAEEPVVGTVVATVAEREARERLACPRYDGHRSAAAGATGPHWYVAARDAGTIVGVAMRTAPFEPYPLFLLPMPEAAALLLARELHARAEAITGANGALPATRTFADETARLTGGEVGVSMHTRLFELGQLTAPTPPPGRLRPVTEDEAGLALDWFRAFHRDADEQAGRPPGDGHAETFFDLDDMLVRIHGERVWFWDDGGPVHLTGANDPAYGVARIGPVYTPKELRGRGYAGAAVAEVSRRIVAAGARACLFTDQANPTSNRLYETLGYRPVVDMANLRVATPGE
ncbi:MAG: GNAT family N-acetyltransferase [Nocardioides sp.]